MTTRKKAAAARIARPRPGAAAPAYLKRLSTAVRSQFAGAVSLPEFLAGAGGLGLEQRKLVVRQALVLFEQNYAHLPLKRAMHSVDPVQRLRLLLQTLELLPAAEQPPETEFHREMTDIFVSVRDLHTNYLLPAPFSQMTAFLPFMVEDCIEGGRRVYIVSHVTQGFQHAAFVPGVEILHWNGVPIDRAVLNNAQRYAGSNRDARHARGVQTLTTRALRTSAPPDEDWVVVVYRTGAGAVEELRLDWLVNPPLPPAADSEAGLLENAAAMGLDLEQDLIQNLRKSLFAPQVVAAEKKAAAKIARHVAFGGLESHMPQVFEARPVDTPSGNFGYLRIRTFNFWQTQGFVEELVRLMSALPQNGLILDVRGNGGGVIMNGEEILQTLTPRPIEPEPVQFINTPLNLEICRRHGPASQWADLSPWIESMQQALQTGAAFSAGFPISDRGRCNAIGQKYFGPVVLITDALCYSTTDIFAAGFQDHEIGPILGVAGNTGAGGANVWEHRHFVSHVLPGAGSVYKALPNGAGMRVSVRRTLRIGRRAGTPVEDLGVLPDERHFMTRRDLLEGNADLIAKAGSMLAGLPVRGLSVALHPASPTQTSVVAGTQGLTRLDIYLDDRPIQTLDLAGEPVSFTVTKAGPAQQVLEIRGFDGTRLAARYRASL